MTGLDRFEARSSLRTWLFQICINRARSLGAREHRTVPVEHIEPAVDAAQFDSAGAWTSPPVPWPDRVTGTAVDLAMVEAIRHAIVELPQLQQLVVTMRDIDGLTSRQVCDVLSISEANQRVLLHRGRTRIRHNLNKAVASR